MPFLNVLLSSSTEPATYDEIAAALTDLTANILGKKRELTAVAVAALPQSSWYVGGASLSAQKLSSFYLEVKVTEGTNTKNEKAKYVDATFSRMTEILGPLSPASYVVIHEVRADAWGYEGKSQEYRYIAGKAL